MRDYLVVLLFLVSFRGPAQTGTGVLPADTSSVRLLIQQSRASQWIDPSLSLSYADKALILAQEMNDSVGAAKAKNLKGFAFWTFGDNDLAIEAALEALQGAGESQPLVKAESYYVLARGYMDVAEQGKAWESIKKAERLAIAGEDWELQTSIYNLMGVVQFVKQRQDSALFYYYKALELGKAHSVHPINFPRIISNIGECYLNENPTVAFGNFFNALEMAKSTGNQIAKASIGAIIGHAYLKKNDLKKSEAYLTEALGLARSLGLRRVVRHAYAGLVDIKLKQGKKDEAMVYQRKYYEVRDSLLNSAKIRQIVELEARHALEMKEQAIRVLESEKRVQTMWTNLLAGTVGVVVLASIAGYQWQRYRYRKNREMLDLEIDYLTEQQNTRALRASLGDGTDEPVASRDQKLMRSAIACVESHISDVAFGVEPMADALHMSRTSLHRKIKALTGFSPSEMIRNIRLHKAGKLILSNADSVTQIAQQVGFDDYSHFSKSFKKHFGVSPSQYADQVAAEKQAS